MKHLKQKIGIVGMASHLPKKVMTSSEIASMANMPEEHIISHLGFRQKRVANHDEHPSTLALKATKKLLRETAFDISHIDFILYCSNGIYDYQFWSPSAYIQHKIKAHKAFTFEITNRCNSAIAGMYLASHLFSNNAFQYGLIIVSDTLSKLIDYRDKNSFPLFSFADGASALLLGKNVNSHIIKSQTMSTDGRFAECNKLLLGGTKNRYSCDSNMYVSVDLNGKETTALRNGAMARNYIKVITKALKLAQITTSDIERFLINQNSVNIINTVLRELDIPADKTYSTRKNYGHIGAIDTLFALEKCIRKKIVKKHDLVLLASTGIGYHWGAQVIEI